MSKIFNFLSSGTYSSLGVNFFRNLEFFKWIGRREKIDPKLEAILKRAEEVIREIYYPNPEYPNPYTQMPLVRQRRLDTLQECYNELKYVTDERAKKIGKGLYVILQENGRRLKEPPSYFYEEDQEYENENFKGLSREEFFKERLFRLFGIL